MNQARPIKTVSNTAVKDLLETCEALDAIAEESFLAIGIDHNMLADPALRFPESKLVELWHKIEEQSNCPHIGLVIGTTINPGAKGILSSWVSQAESIAEALDIFRQHISLMNPSEKWCMQNDETVCTLKFSFNGHKAYPSIATERSMAALVSWGRALSGHAFPIIEACFDFTCPLYEEKFTSIFGHNIYFNMPENSLKFDSEMLQLPLANGNHYLKSLMGGKAKALLHRLGEDHSFSLKTKNAIRKIHSQKGMINVDAVCSELGISRQTLYRKLKEEGRSYKSLSEDFKKAESLKLLQKESVNITSISLHLGFKDSSSFYKAFKRWFGVTPNAYLRSLEE